MIYVESIEKKLPLYLENFNTSVGITTSINLYRASDDEAEIVRLEIYGPSYLNSDSDEKKNPNVTAFKESYAKALEMLEGQNIDPKVDLHLRRQRIRAPNHPNLDRRAQTASITRNFCFLLIESSCSLNKNNNSSFSLFLTQSFCFSVNNSPTPAAILSFVIFQSLQSPARDPF